MLFNYLVAVDEKKAVVEMFQNPKMVKQLLEHFDILKQKKMITFLGLNVYGTNENMTKQITNHFIKFPDRFLTKIKPTFRKYQAVAFLQTSETMFMKTKLSMHDD